MLRKTGSVGEGSAGECRASMRPQRNAAENGSAGRAGAAGYDASMRPQRNAAENLICLSSQRPIDTLQ